MKFKLQLNGNDYLIEISRGKKGQVKIKVDQEEFLFEDKKETGKISVPGTYLPKKDFSKKEIKAPIAGLVSTVFVKEGAEIKTDDKIILLSSMKMENEIVTEFDGRIKKLLVREGQEIKQGDTIAQLE